MSETKKTVVTGEVVSSKSGDHKSHKENTTKDKGVFQEQKKAQRSTTPQD